MARRGPSDADKERIALQASRRMIAVGERPGYHLRSEDGRWRIEEAPWLLIEAGRRLDALAAARTAVASWLDVELDAFDVEAADD